MRVSAKQEILARARAALSAPPPPRTEPAHEAPAPPAAAPAGDLVALLVERLEDYRARVVRCEAHDVPDAVRSALADAGAASVVVPPGLDPAWTDGVEHVVPDHDGLGAAELDEIDAVVTAAAVAIAETGTVVLDHAPDQGRRALTLVPDVHVCVVRTGQVVADVPDAVVRLADAVRAGRPQTWVSGPSATSDIELTRVEGVHGPRTLVVVLAG